MAKPHLPPQDPDDGFTVPLSDEAPGFADIFEYLKTPVAISRRVAPACANTVSQTLAILINGLLEKRTWGALFRLLLFPRIAMAARKPGDDTPTNGARDAFNDRCVFVLRSGIPAILWRWRDN